MFNCKLINISIFKIVMCFVVCFRVSRVMAMFNAAESKKGNFLEQTKAAREERAQEKRKETAATSIQAFVRGWLSRKRFTQEIL